MPLHDLVADLTPLEWRWYSAFVRREGRRHLLQVPTVRVNPDQVSIPGYMSLRNYTSEEARGERYDRFQQEQGAYPWIPGWIEDGLVSRYCQRRQSAESWHNAYPPRFENERGVCQDCYSHWRSMHHTDDITRSRPSGTLNTAPEDWHRRVLTHLTGPR